MVSDGEEAVARAQLKKLGWAEELFELVVGADSGAHVEPCGRLAVWPSGRVACRPGARGGGGAAGPRGCGVPGCGRWLQRWLQSMLQWWARARRA